MVSSDGSDKQLVRAFQRGDDGAFTRLARRHQDRLFRLAILWLDDPQAAGDATQETLLRAYRGLSAFRFAAAPFTWLYRTQRRVCHELNRQRKTMPLPDVLAAPTTDTGDRIDREAAVLAVRRQVRHLPERQREVVVLRIFEDKDA